MDILDIKIFLSIVDTNSISRTAEQLHFSQSTVSYHLQNLEKEVGVPLFYRSKGKRNAKLTMQGEYFVRVAKQWESVWRDTQEIKLLPANSLSISAIDSVSTTLLSEVYREVTEGSDPIKLRIMTHQSWEIYDLVENQSADIGFISIPQQRKNVITQPLFSQNYYVIRYSKRPTAPRRISPQSLDPQYEIYQYWGGDYELWHESLWGPLTNYHVWIDSVALIPTFLTDERYWSILPETSLQSAAVNFRNVQIDQLDLPTEYRRICYMLKHRSPKLSSLHGIKVFEQSLAAHIKKLGIVNGSDSSRAEWL